MSGKRRHNELTLEVKVKILQAVDKGDITKVQIAKNFNVPQSTLSTILKNRVKIETTAAECGKLGLRKRIRCAKHGQLEDELYEWFCQARASNIPISGTVLKEKADLIAMKQKIEGFHCSNGWLQRFQKRRGIVSLGIHGEAASVDEDAIETWFELNRPVLERYANKDIFNMDEAGVFYNVLPNTTLALKGEKCRGGKKSKERVTVVFCCNSNGSEKLKLLVVGKFANPRCFKGVHHFPCDYRSNRNSWMTTKLFREWLLQLERRMAVRDRKILLLLDHCSAHNAEGMELNNVRVLFLPPNTTSKMQPLDQGIIHHVKLNYRRRLVRYLLRQMELQSETKKWTVLDAIRNVSCAWDAVSAEVITNCFRKAGIQRTENPIESDSEPEESSEDAVDAEEWARIRETFPCDVNFNEFATFDDDVVTCPEEIPRENEAPNEANPNVTADGSLGLIEAADASVSDSDSDAGPEPPSKKDVFASLFVIEKMMQTSDNSSEVMGAFDILSEFVQNKYCSTMRQKSLDEYFTSKPKE